MVFQSVSIRIALLAIDNFAALHIYSCQIPRQQGDFLVVGIFVTQQGLSLNRKSTQTTIKLPPALHDLDGLYVDS